MNAPNLFDHLEGYAQENFVTETLAYLLQKDAIVRNHFLDLLLAGKGKKLRAVFSECEIDTQFSFDIGRPDLRITSRSDDSKQVLFVEVMRLVLRQVLPIR